MAQLRTFTYAAEQIYPAESRPRARTVRERMAAEGCVIPGTALLLILDNAPADTASK